MAPNKCAYFMCNNTSDLKSMFRFPSTDSKRLPVWSYNCGNMTITHLNVDKLRNRYLCQDHFDEKYVQNIDGRRMRISKKAIPKHYRGDEDLDFSPPSPIPSTKRDTMNENEMFEIDPKLFVTCRLCLDNTGVFQIVPSVQKQIKFCYEIEVDPFDGLPQLICRDCELILRTYFEVKTNYAEKQNKLRERLKHNDVTTQSAAIQQEDGVVTSSQEISSVENNVHKKRIISFSSSTSEASEESGSVTCEIKRKNSCESMKETDDLDRCYKKWFVCRFCNHQSRNKSKIIRHVNKHTSLKQKYLNLIKRDCYVKLNKIDNVPNICKSKKYVVHSSDKIIHSINKFYHVIMRPKVNSNCERDSSPDISHSRSGNSDDDIITTGGRTKPRRNRILSNDTVVIGKDDLDSTMLDEPHKEPANPITSAINDDECISIDDSETESVKSEVLTNVGVDLSSSVNSSECKSINNIISLCFKRHLSRLESNDTIEANIPSHTIEKPAAKIDSHLKHKVLSIGKKMINNSAFSCTGILRYLEHQNLEIVWTPKMPRPANKKPDCVRIMMKLKNHDEDDIESGWTVLENTNKENKQPNNDVSIVHELNPNNDNTCKEMSEQNVIRHNNADSTEGGAVLHAVKMGQDKDKMLRKLLNENPVANPKTLMKKPPAPSTVLNKKKRTKCKDKSANVDRPTVGTADNVLLMPVITSTVSLAPGDAGKQQPARSTVPTVPITLIAGPSAGSSTIPSVNRTIPEQDLVANFPRIKVKSASQLMSNPTLNIMTQQYIPQVNMFVQSQNVNMAYQYNSNAVNMNMVPIPILANTNAFQSNLFAHTLFEANAHNVPMSSENKSKESVVMHSIDLPNTKTTSPFAYLKRLLQIHNIYLLNPDEITQDMIRDFVCLLKFKLVFQQECASPVALCLALYNSTDKFFVKIKGVHDVDIDICRLSPNWQWEILKVYAGEVVPKMLENAEKVGPEVLVNTRNFVCYLNSIEFRKNV